MARFSEHNDFSEQSDFSEPKVRRAGCLEQLLFVCIVVLVALVARPTDLLPSKATGNKHLRA